MMEPIRINLSPGAKTQVDLPHEGEEFGYVLAGEITLCLGKKKFVCKKGNSFYYKADKPHYVINNKNSRVIIYSSGTEVALSVLVAQELFAARKGVMIKPNPTIDNSQIEMIENLSSKISELADILKKN